MPSCQGYESVDTELVYEIPSGFINLKDATEKTKGVMEYIFFEDYFSLVDIDGSSVGGAMVNDSSYIVQYQGEYYVNEEKFLEALEIATVSPEQRKKRYSLDDTIEMRGAGETIYTVRITVFDSIKKDDVTTYTIKYSVASDTDENGREPIIKYIETKDGIGSTLYNDNDSGTVTFDVNKNRELDTIYFYSPDFPWFDYIIAVDR